MKCSEVKGTQNLDSETQGSSLSFTTYALTGYVTTDMSPSEYVLSRVKLGLGVGGLGQIFLWKILTNLSEGEKLDKSR